MRSGQSHFWQGRRCLITGGLGCGGSHLSQLLLEKGAVVYALDRVRLDNSYMVLTGLIDRVEFIQGDVRDLELMKDTLQRFEIDAVFHLAAQPVVPLSNIDPYDTLSNNVMGTYSVLEAVRTSKYGNSLVFASSGAYYGTSTGREPINEEQAPAPASNIYAPSKVAGDIAVRCYAQVYGMKAAVCRFINTYGPGNTHLSTIVPKAIINLITGAPYDFGDRDDGTTQLDFLHVRDMARGYMAVVENIESVSGEAFNFGGGNLISIRDLVRLISRLFDGKEREPVFGGSSRDIPLCKCLDTSKARRVLGWQPSISLVDGLKETIQWYRRFWQSYQQDSLES